MLCLAACAAVVALWARRAATTDVVAFCSPAGHWQAAASTREGLAVFTSGIPAGPEWAWRVRSVSVPADDVDDASAAVFDPTNVHNSLGGFKLAGGTFTIGPQTPGYRAVLVPHWAAALPLAVPPLLWARGRLRRRRWRKQGRCRHCGYDLRGSPERCPECGKPGANAAAIPAEHEGQDRVDPAESMNRVNKIVVIGIVFVVTGAIVFGMTTVVRRSVARAGVQADDGGRVVRVYDAEAVARQFCDTPNDPAVRRYESPANDPESPENRQNSNVCFPGPTYTGPYPRVVDEWPDRFRGFGDMVLFATDAARDGDYIKDVPSTGQVVVVASRTVQAQYAQLLQFLRDPAMSGMTLIVAGETAPPSARGVQDAERKLAEVLPEVRFDDVPLEEAFEQLAESAKANLVVDWAALEGAGVDRGTLVRLHVWDLPLSRVIAVMLAAAADDGGALLGVRAGDGVVRITTRAALATSGVVTRAYDVRRLVEAILADRRRQMETASRAASRPADGNDDYADEGMTWEEAIESISTFIKEDVDPDSWRDNGGEVGAVREFGGRLFIRQTPEGHRGVEETLKVLNDAITKE